MLQFNYKFVKFTINIDSKCEMYYYKSSNGVDLGIFKLAYYWGVYPKLKDKKLVVNFNWVER